MTKVPVSIGRNRSCGSCTKCCEGWLSANINGIEMSPGTPCYLVQLGVGCSDYENRPENPCKTFSCSWLSNLDIPEHLSPLLTGVIISEQVVDGIEYLSLIPAGSDPSPEMLSWFLEYCKTNKLNADWNLNGKRELQRYDI